MTVGGKKVTKCESEKDIQGMMRLGEVVAQEEELSRVLRRMGDVGESKRTK